MKQRSLFEHSGRFIFLLLLHIVLQSVIALKCRSNEGPSDADLKRVARSCMQKVGENSSKHWSTGSGASSSNMHNNERKSYQQQQQQDQNKEERDQWSYGGQNSRGKMYYGYGENGNDGYEDDGADRDTRNNNYDRDYSGDILTQRNRERMQNQQHSARSSNNGQSSRGEGNGGSGSQRGSSSGSSNNNNNIRNNNRFNNNKKVGNDNNNGNNGNSSDAACVVHCFFDEMNLLNHEDFPDRYKITSMLTKNLHDRELRSFYTETIQDCFRYVESERRRSDRCQFSRDLISCMTEFARANCDDWDNYGVLFN